MGPGQLSFPFLAARDFPRKSGPQLTCDHLRSRFMANDGVRDLGYWISRGLGERDSIARVVFVEDLAKWTQMLRLRPRRSEFYINLSPIRPSELAEGILMHDDAMLPLWKDFSDAISALNENSYRFFGLSIQDIQISKQVLDMLTLALNESPVKVGFLMKNNRLPRDGIRCVSKFCELNESLLYLGASNPIESKLDAVSLAQAVRRHPCLRDLLCGAALGQRPTVMSTIISALGFSTLETVALCNNEIGARGALLISDFLSSNPKLQKLWLDGNLLDDDSVALIARSLKKNTNLRELTLTATGLGLLEHLLCSSRYMILAIPMPSTSQIIRVICASTITTCSPSSTLSQTRH